MLETKHHWLPVILAFYLPLSFIITYSIAVANGHVKAGFPYISDTGTFPPESCIFGQLLNIGAVICGVIVYIRYRHILLLFSNTPGRQGLLRLNMASFVVGLLAGLGVSLVGNFQETSVIQVHLLGAFMAFGIGFVYCFLQTVISYKMVSTTSYEMPGNTLITRRLRVALCVVDVVLLLLLFGGTALAQSKGPGNGIPIYLWTSSEPGYSEHLVSTISEWLIAVVSVIYFGTFYTEFKHFRVKPPEIIFYDPDVLKETRPDIAVTIIS